MIDVTLITPYYRNPRMLAHQLLAWELMPDSFRIMIIDDCSPEPALPVVMENAGKTLLDRITMYRIKDDIAWNQHGARNLGAMECKTQWMLMFDIDHVLAGADDLLHMAFCTTEWYRFKRYRIDVGDGRVEITSAPNVFLCTRSMFLATGGYNEDYCGCYGGDDQFLLRMKKVNGNPIVLPDPVSMEVHTPRSIPDAATLMDRSPKEYQRRLATTGIGAEPENPLRFPWERVL